MSKTRLMKTFQLIVERNQNSCVFYLKSTKSCMFVSMVKVYCFRISTCLDLMNNKALNTRLDQIYSHSHFEHTYARLWLGKKKGPWATSFTWATLELKNKLYEVRAKIMGQSMCKIDHVFDHELDFHNFLQMFLCPGLNTVSLPVCRVIAHLIKFNSQKWKQKL